MNISRRRKIKPEEMFLPILTFSRNQTFLYKSYYRIVKSLILQKFLAD